MPDCDSCVFADVKFLSELQIVFKIRRTQGTGGGDHHHFRIPHPMNPTLRWEGRSALVRAAECGFHFSSVSKLVRDISMWPGSHVEMLFPPVVRG